MTDYIYKELTTDQLFDCCVVLDVIGAEQVIEAFDAKEIQSLSASGKSERGVGIAIVMKLCKIVLKNLPGARTEICSFLAGCVSHADGTAYTGDEIRQIPAGQFIALLKGFFMQDEIMDFFGEVARLAGMGQSDSESSSGENTPTQEAILNGCLRNRRLTKAISTVLEENEREQCWSLYLAYAANPLVEKLPSFEDFRRQVTRKPGAGKKIPKKDPGVNNEKIKQQVLEAQALLDGFNPPRGGDGGG